MKKVPIPAKMQKFYGIGTMLHPDQEMVVSLLKEIPEGRVATIDSLCDRLARDHGTDVTCPMRTTNFIKKITALYSDGHESVPFWRVIRKNHLLINSPLITLCAEKLENEGFHLTQNSKGDVKVQQLGGRLFSFL
ncbi:MAG: hypothetical protein AAGI38_05620 [Bacteroidota bacterium]